MQMFDVALELKFTQNWKVFKTLPNDLTDGTQLLFLGAQVWDRCASLATPWWLCSKAAI